MGSNKNNRIRPTTIDFVVSWEGAEGIGGVGPVYSEPTGLRGNFLNLYNWVRGASFLDLCRKIVSNCIG